MVSADLSKLPSRYQIVRLLGSGSQKQVFLARDQALGRLVAISVLSTDDAGGLLRDGIHEAQALARISDHPHVVSIFDLIESPPVLYIISQYAAGGTLRELLTGASEKRLPLERALKTALQLSRALGFAHEHGVVHQDLKPENVLLDERGNALLADLGVSEVRGLRRVLDPDTMAGTPAYMAPEVITGGTPSPSSDLYALGCLLYELVSGRPPFVSESYGEVLRMHREREPLPLIDALATAPVTVSDLVSALLAKDPFKRPRSGREVGTALEGILAMEGLRPSIPRVGPGRMHLTSQSGTKIFGRDTEIEIFRQALRRAQGGHSSLLILQGDSGAGKTRLVHELRSMAAARGMTTLIGSGREDSPLPYGAIAEAFRPLASELPWLPDDAAEALRSLLSLESRSEGPSDAQPRDIDHLAGSILDMLRSVAEQCPLLIVLDDLQWVDSASRILFERLASMVVSDFEESRLRLLMLCALRRNAGGPAIQSAVDRISRHASSMLVDVEGLDLPAVRDLIESLGIERPANQLAQLVMEFTSGNPLFVREFVRHLKQAGRLEARGGFTMLIGEPGDIAFPISLASAIAERVQRVAEQCQNLLTAAAFIGPRFELEQLADLEERSEDDVLSTLEGATVEGLITDLGHAFQFVHPLIRRTFLQRLTPTRRQRMHLRIARRLQALKGDADVVELAHHMLGAGAAADPQTALDYARRAGEAALRKFAWNEAARFFEAVLSLDAGQLAPEVRAETHRQAGVAYVYGSDVGPARYHLSEAIRDFKQAGDARGHAATVVEKFRFLSIHGALRIGELGEVEELHGALAALGDSHSELRARILGALGDVYWNARLLDEGERCTRSALEIALGLGDHSLCAEIYLDVATCQAQRLLISESIRSLEAGMEHARRGQNSLQLDRCAQRLAPLLAMAGQLDDVPAAVERTRGIRRSDLLISPMCQAMVGAIRGKLADAEARAEQAVRRMSTSKLSWAGSSVLTTLAYARASRGDSRGADDALDLLLQPGFVFNQPNPRSFSVYRHLIRIYAGLDVDDLALEDMRSVRNADQPDYFSVMQASIQVELAFSLGRRCVDDSPLRTLRRAGESDLLFTPAWPFLVPRIEGLALFMEGKVDEAEARFERAIRIATRLSADTELCRALIDFGSMLSTREDGRHEERGSQLLRRAGAMMRGRFSEGLADRVLIRSRSF